MRRLSALAFLGALCWAGPGLARVTETTAYTRTQALNAAFRYLRVDSSYTITEKDLELGYLLFEYPTGQGDHTTIGSIEVIEREDEVVLVVQIAKLPSYHESMLVRGLVSKLRADYGEPPKARKSKPTDKDPPPPKDNPSEDPPSQGKEGKAPEGPSANEPVPRYRIK